MILDRLMKAMITARKNDLATPTQPTPMPFLGHREKNVVHYMLVEHSLFATHSPPVAVVLATVSWF